MEEYEITEYKEVVATYRDNVKVLLQVMTFLVTANVAIVGAVIEGGAVNLLIAGGAIMLLLARACWRQAIIMIPVIVRGLQLENQLGEKGLIHFQTAAVWKTPEQLDQIYNTPNQIEKIADLNKALVRRFVRLLKYQGFAFNVSQTVFYAILGAGLVQIGIGLYCAFDLNWF